MEKTTDGAEAANGGNNGEKAATAGMTGSRDVDKSTGAPATKQPEGEEKGGPCGLPSKCAIL